MYSSGVATKPIQMRFPDELLARIDAAADRDHVSRTAVVMAACEAWLGEEPGSKKPKRETGAEKCRHPVGRRIGGLCALCGERP